MEMEHSLFQRRQKALSWSKGLNLTCRPNILLQMTFLHKRKVTYHFNSNIADITGTDTSIIILNLTLYF